MRVFAVCRRLILWIVICRFDDHDVVWFGSWILMKEETIPETVIEIEDLEIEREFVNIDFEIGDHVVYLYHGVG